MSSYDDLKDALKETLETRGTLSEIKARIRAEVFRALEDEDEPKPHPARETELLNELVREYLKYSGYRHTLSVFSAEADLPRKAMERKELTSELDVSANSYPPSIPLLYGLALRNAVKKEQERVESLRLPSSKGKGGALESSVDDESERGGNSLLPADINDRKRANQPRR